MVMKERIVYLDYMRALAAVAVVVLHVAANNWYGFIGTPDWNSFTFYLGCTRFSVPLFVMISGALFLRKEGPIDVKRMLCHNVVRLLLFLLFWSVIYQLYHLISAAGAFAPQLLWQAVKNVLKGETQAHLWFLYMMIGLYLVCPIVKTFSDHASKKQLEYALLLFFVFDCLMTVLRHQENPFSRIASVNMSKLGIAVVSGYVGYFILGHYLDRYPLQRKYRIGLYVLGIGSLLFTIGATYLESVAKGACEEIYLNYLTPNVFFMSAAVYTAMSKIQCAKGVLDRGMKQIADSSFGIYGVHMLFVFFFWNAGIDTFRMPGIISVPLLSAVILMISLFTVKGLKRIPGIRRLL